MQGQHLKITERGDVPFWLPFSSPFTDCRVPRKRKILTHFLINKCQTTRAPNYALNPELRREKGQIGRDGLEMLL